MLVTLNVYALRHAHALVHFIQKLCVRHTRAQVGALYSEIDNNARLYYMCEDGPLFNAEEMSALQLSFNVSDVFVEAPEPDPCQSARILLFVWPTRTMYTFFMSSHTQTYLKVIPRYV